MKHSLKKRATLYILAATLTVGIVLSAVCIGIAMVTIKSAYEEKADDLAKTVAVSVSPEDVETLKDAVNTIYDSADSKVNSTSRGTEEYDAYADLYKDIYNREDFKELRIQLRKYQSANHVDCIYLAEVIPEDAAGVYLVDGAYDDACPPGCIDPIYAENQGVLKNPELGMPAFVTMTNYGWLVSSGSPIFSKDGSVLGYACVDISMNEILTIQLKYAVLIVVVLTILSVFFALLYTSIVQKRIIHPIRILAAAAAEYGYDPETTKDYFSKIDIHTGNELEALADNLKIMESTMNDRASQLEAAKFEANAALQQTTKTAELQLKDALTGIRNRNAYKEELKKLEWEIDSVSPPAFAIGIADINSLMVINEKYGHDKGNIAIQTLCRIVCRTFHHSPVFRIGGDEFAIILKNEDLAHRFRLTQMFYDRIQELIDDRSLSPWEQINASLGIGMFHPETDRDASGAIDRAQEDLQRAKKARKIA